MLTPLTRDDTEYGKVYYLDSDVHRDNGLTQKALSAVLGAFDCGENRSIDRNPAKASALKLVYTSLGMTWPELDSEAEEELT